MEEKHAGRIQVVAVVGWHSEMSADWHAAEGEEEEAVGALPCLGASQSIHHLQKCQVAVGNQKSVVGAVVVGGVFALAAGAVLVAGCVVAGALVPGYGRLVGAVDTLFSAEWVWPPLVLVLEGVGHLKERRPPSQTRFAGSEMLCQLVGGSTCRGGALVRGACRGASRHFRPALLRQTAMQGCLRNVEQILLRLVQHPPFGSRRGIG